MPTKPQCLMQSGKSVTDHQYCRIPKTCAILQLVSTPLREHSLFMAGGGLTRIRGVIIFFSKGMGDHQK